MRILHLAYEDPRQPGSGGGSVRTLEINRRLAQRHEITAVVSGYAGAQARVEDGIRWIPIGTRWRYMADKLSYFALLGVILQRHQYDLVVEDFGAPFSVGFAPLFTRQPVVASTQWLFASQMREKYHLPFDWIERFGLHFYHDFITVSEWLADEVRRRCGNVKVEAIPNGIEPIAFTVQPQEPRYFVFVGRLDIAQKGCDLLLAAMAAARQTLGDALPPLKIIGDGPDQPQLEALVKTYHLSEVVEFCGRVTGQAKYQMMAGAYAVLMPSRFETFGMVAAEAQAASAPVIAFDTGPLREVAGAGGAKLARPFDVADFAAHMVELVEHPRQVEALRQQGRGWARRYNWDEIAQQQEQHYLRALENHR